jgi:hypothetical protein
VLALVEIAVAFAIAFLAFGKDERPAPPEEHVLGVAPRAAIQGVVVALAFMLLSVVWEVRVFAAGAVERHFLSFEAGLFLTLPVAVETAARARPASWKRDLATAGLVWMAGAAACELAAIATAYSQVLVAKRSHEFALTTLRLFIEYRYAPGPWPWMHAAQAFAFVAPALARLRGARAPAALAAGLAGGVVGGAFFLAIGFATDAAVSAPAGVYYALAADQIPNVLALSLGGAFSDKLLRRLEARLDPVRPSAPR